MKLIVVGCASGMPSPNLSHSCYLVGEADRLLMFDCGGGAPSALVRCRIDTSSIDNVFISHTHPDHVTGLPMFIQMEYLKNRRESLAIHIPSEFEQPFRAMMQSHYLFPEKINFDIIVKTIQDDFRFREEGVSVRAFANSHLFGHSEFLGRGNYVNRMQCFSFLISSGGKKLAYSADIGCLDDLKLISRDADLLLTEGMHLDLSELPAFLIEQGVRRCLLTHLPDGFDREETRMSFAESGYGSVEFADEGLIVHI